MKTFFKYTGGKTRELKKIRPHVSSSNRVIEPFAGSCAVAFDCERAAIVGDLDDDVINLLQTVRDPKLFPELLDMVQNTNIDLDSTPQNTEHLEQLYYAQRDDMWQVSDPLKKAYRFLILRQLCFSGMTRFNLKTGKSNVPFGWYRKFQTRLGKDHHELLQAWDIQKRSWEHTLEQAKSGDWVFLDPPYLERNSSYEVGSDAGVDENFHRNIREHLRYLDKHNIPWLMVHSDCELYREIYRDTKITYEKMFYSQNFKGAGVKDARVGHLYISPADGTSNELPNAMIPEDRTPSKRPKPSKIIKIPEAVANVTQTLQKFYVPT